MAGRSAVVLMSMVMVVMVTGHSVELGPCKPKTGDQNFQPNQLEGLWYVIKIFSTNSRCMTITFNVTEGGFTGTEARELFLGRKVGLDHTVTNTGFFTIKDPQNPAQMRVRWPSNFLGVDADVTVMDIEPGVFAVLYECQSLFVVRRTSAVILSREPTLDGAVVQRIEKDLSAADIDVGDFDNMNHNNCKKPGEANFNFNVNDVIGSGFPRVSGSGGAEVGSGAESSAPPSTSSSTSSRPSSTSSSSSSSSSTPTFLEFPVDNGENEVFNA